MKTIELNKNIYLISFTILTELLFVLLLTFSLLKGYELFLFALFAAIPIIFLFFYYPKLWIYVSILLFAPILALRDEGISPLEIVFSIVVILGLVVYFVFIFFVKKKPVILNFGDFLILSFFFLVPINALVAYLNDVNLLFWLREVLILFLLLLYFPIRDFFKDEKDFNRLLFFGLIVSLVCALYVIVSFRESTLMMASYAYELFALEGTKKVNHIVFVSAYFAAIILAQNRNNIIIILLLFTTAFLSLLALIITVSRTFWIATILGTIVLFLYFNWKERMRLILFYSIISLLFLGAVYFTFKDNYKVVTNLIENRFISSLKGKRDKSLQSRFAEYSYVLGKIAENPLSGNGFAKKIRFRDPIFVRTLTTHNIHNGFTSILYRAGIPLAILYSAFFIYYFVKATRLIILTKNNRLQPYAVTAFVILLMMFIGQFTFQMYLARDFNFAGAISVAMIDFVERNYLRT